MKIFLASFLQKENFGSGKIISITASNKPKDIVVKEIYLPVTPSQAMIDEYYHLMEEDKVKAGEFFRSSYTAQLDKFVEAVKKAAEEDSVTPMELLPFEEGDTLCSWERAQYTNYRKILAPFLEKLGYEVVLN